MLLPSVGKVTTKMSKHKALPNLLMALLLLFVSGCIEANPEFNQAADQPIAPGTDSGVTPDLEPYSRDPDRGPADDKNSPDSKVVDPDTTPATSCVESGCYTPPNDCYSVYGSCDEGTGLCTYSPLPQGTSCVPQDPCEEDGYCDGQGQCYGTPVTCSAPNASGGTCVAGACEGFTCDPDWADCNADWSDGCETDTSSDPGHCGGCQNACATTTGANTTGGCEGGQCTVTCVDPYEDCNNDLSDGCEIPTGVANSCDKDGLTVFSSAKGATPGCGTPHCGAGKSGYGVKSFGTWHCSFCSHCKLFDDGYAWCLPSLGRFSAQRCQDCCKPGDPKFPQVCQ